MKYVGMMLVFAAVAVTSLLAIGGQKPARAESAPDARKAVAPTAQQDPELARIIAEEREARAARRAYYTAPPVIPHELFPASAGDCLTCHKQEGQFFGKISPVTPHPQWSNCNQCHLPSAPAFKESEPVTLPETTWQGLATPTDGTRAHVVAPPVVPHRQFLRESCLTCHSFRSPYASLRCPHPERTNCTQCHVSAGENEFRLDKEKLLPR